MVFILRHRIRSIRRNERGGIVDINIAKATPPEKVHTDRAGSKYDEAIRLAIAERGEWIQVGTTPVENRNSIYSTASAIRGGRLANIPEGENIQIVCRRVDDDVVMFIKAL